MSNEKERRVHEFEWETKKKKIQQCVGMIDIKKTAVPEFFKSLTTLLNSNLVKVGDQMLIENDTPIKTTGNTKLSGNFGELYTFLKKRSGAEEYVEKAMDIDELKFEFKENPFLHPLSKSLNLGVFDADFLTENVIVTKEVFDKISKGEELTHETDGVWNADVDFIKSNIDSFQKTRKLLYNANDTVTVLTLYYTQLIEE